MEDKSAEAEGMEQRLVALAESITLVDSRLKASAARLAEEEKQLGVLKADEKKLSELGKALEVARTGISHSEEGIARNEAAAFL